MVYYYIVSLMFGGFAALGSGIIALIRGGKNSVNRLWFFVTVCSAAWSFGYMSMITAKTIDQAWYANWLLHAAAIILPSVTLHFMLVLTRQEKDIIAKVFLTASYFLSAVFFSLNPTRLFVQNVLPKYIFNYVCDAGPLYIYFTIFYVITFLVSAYYLYKGLSVEGVDRHQIKYILIAELGAVGGGSVFFLTFNINIPPYLIILYSIYPVIIGYAIIRYRLMGIRTIASKLFTYILLASFGYAMFYISIFIEDILFGGIYSYEAMAFSPVLAVVFAMSIVPFFKKVQKSNDIIFFHGITPQAIIRDIGAKLSSVIELNQLIRIVIGEFKRVLATEEIDIFLFNKNQQTGEESCLSLLENKPRRLTTNNIVCTTVLRSKKILVRDELERIGKKTIVNEMDRLKVKIIAPLTTRDRIIGLVFLGEKIEQGAYTQEDYDFLEIISSQAAVAIENARLYKEVDDFNKTLQQQVDVQTKELRDKAEHLRKLMEMRSEFLDITSHQLRTPVSVIKGVLSMLEEGSIPEAKKDQFIKGALEKSIKLGEIINDILRASEMDTDKFTLHLKEVDLNEILKKIRDDKVRTAQVKKVDLIFNLPNTELPTVLSDDRYIEQAIVNLINNSFQYTPQGSVTVSAEIKPKSVVIRVSDTGIGIPKKDVSKLFQKFGRAENAVATFTDGSGLGLYIIKEIVDANPGAKIQIESTEVGKGTTFALTLPIFDAKVFAKIEAERAANVVAK